MTVDKYMINDIVLYQYTERYDEIPSDTIEEMQEELSEIVNAIKTIFESLTSGQLNTLLQNENVNKLYTALNQKV